jgi:hypothetical protein
MRYLADAGMSSLDAWERLRTRSSAINLITSLTLELEGGASRIFDVHRSAPGKYISLLKIKICEAYNM